MVNPNANNSRAITVTLLGKPGCHLCEEAREQIQAAREQVPFEFREVNILEDQRNYQRYALDIPVVAVNGVEMFRHQVSAPELLERLKALAG